MAIYNASPFAEYKERNLPIPQGAASGKLRTTFGEILDVAVLTGGLGLQIGDTVRIGALTDQVILRDATLWYGALGASTQLKMGIIGDDDLIMALASSASAGRRDMSNIDGFGYRAIGNKCVILTVGGAAITTGLIRAAFDFAVE